MKRRIHQIISLALVCLLVFSLCSCGKEEFNNVGKTENEKLVWYLGGNNIFAGDVDVEKLFEGYEDTVDPAKIYSSLELTEDMIHGVYTLNNKEKDLKTVREEIPFEDVNFKDGTQNITILPTAVYLGSKNICSSETGYRYDEFKNVTDHEVAVIEFATADKIGHVPCIYEINGKTITFKQITKTSGEEDPFTYEFTGIEFTYDFALSGPYMTFSKGEHSLKLKAYCLTENTDDALSMHGYSLPDSPLIGNLDFFASATAWNYAVTRDGSYFDLSAYKIDDAGRFTICLAERDMVSGDTDEFVNQYAYIIQSEAGNFSVDFSVILLDGEKIYYYTDSIIEREARALEQQGVDVDAMSEEEIKTVAEKKADLFDELQSEFEANGINAIVNRSTGEIALDSTVLFGVDEFEVSDDGKAFLQKFMGVYTSVVFSEKYQGFISKIIVEGHTDTNGSYELNKTLSQNRADSVKNYCLSEECGVGQSYAATLQEMLEAVGFSYDNPIYNSNGEVDMNASRRVSFKFIVNIENR